MRLVPGSNQAIILIVVTLVSHCWKLFAQPLTPPPNFLLIKNYPREIHDLKLRSVSSEYAYAYSVWL